jgi:hypothetical protein
MAPKEVLEKFGDHRFGLFHGRHGEAAANNDLQSSKSHVDSINPLEDPFSDAGMDNTIDNNQIKLGFSQSGLTNIPSSDRDIDMK